MDSMTFLPSPPLAYRNPKMLLHVAIPFCPPTSKIVNSLPLMYMYVYDCIFIFTSTLWKPYALQQKSDLIVLFLSF